MLEDCEVIAFTQTAHPERAKAFYRYVLGLKLQGESEFALVFSGGDTMLLVQKVRETHAVAVRRVGLALDGAKVCWFKDPDGNVLSLTQFP